MQNTIKINVENRKYQMQLKRGGIDIETWEKYIEKNYPKWHKEIYQDKWPVRIIYYDKNRYGIFELYLSRWSSIKSIIQKLNLIIDGQFKMIDRCFGIDIAENIKKFLYNNFDIMKEFMYMHRNIYDMNINTNHYLLEDLPSLHKGKYYTKQRWILKFDTTINNIASKIGSDAIISRYTVLRLRNNYEFNPKVFNGII